jgi:hypothetical protein
VPGIDNYEEIVIEQRTRDRAKANRIFVIVLRLLALAFFAVAAVHLTLGLGADVLLGANVPDGVLTDPALDSQNRFYGVAFALYGVLLVVCSNDLVRYVPVARCTFLVFFTAGLARLISIAARGIPPPLVLALLATEMLIPPIMLCWLSTLDGTYGPADNL